MFNLFKSKFFGCCLIVILMAGLNILTETPASAQDAAEPQGSEGICRGVVTDELGPVVGAAVMIKGSQGGVTTGIDGEYTLSGLKSGDVIVVSILGYETQEVTYAGQSTQNFLLVEASEFLDEVVVTALGIRREERALAYNVQQVSSETINAVKDANFVNSLVGKVAGVTINASANGQGGASRVVMRGVKSLTGTNQALYVIDGIPMFNLTNSGSASVYSEQPGTDGAADINPEDIESISLLTGPSAAALYGNAAASGVVLITTKKGEAGRTKVNFSNSTTFSSVAMMPEMQSKYGNLSGAITSWGNVVNSDYNPRDFFETGANIITSVSLSTGTAKNQTYLSASSTNTTGILPNTAYDRYNFTGRNTTKFANDKLTLDISASFIKQYDRNMMSQGIYYNPLPGLYLFPRGESFEDVRMFERYNSTLGYYEQYWPYGGETAAGMQNPYWVQYRELRENDKKRYMLGASLSWEVTDWLELSGRVKLDNYNNRETYKIYASTHTMWGGENGAYSDVVSTSNNTYADALATIRKNWGEFSLNANVGASINDNVYELLGYNGLLAELPNFFAIHNLDMSTKYKPQQSGYHDQSQAVFANLELGWKSMLYLTVTGRNDWESRLAFSNYSSFFYPSVGLSAVISNMLPMPSWMPYLKIRGSYTEVGNSYDRYMTQIFYSYDGESNSWTSSSTYPNLDLKPERTKSREVGLDVRFLDSISLDVTFYRSNTYNQTFYAPLPSSSGYTQTPVQSGNIMNQGIELATGYGNNWGDFSFSTSYTFTWNQNKIISLVDSITNPFTGELIDMSSTLQKGSFGGLSDAKILLMEGGSMGDVYASYLLTRDYNGNIYYDSSSGLTMENVGDFYLGSILPKFHMGWNLSFGYKNLNLSATFAARIGGIVLSATESYLDNYGVSKRSADARDAGGVTINQGTVSAQEYYTTISGYAAYYTYSATNVRLNDLSLDYTLPSKWFKDKVNLSVGFVGKNLWMIYCKAPFDPELSAEVSSNYYQGFDAFMLPSTRNVGFNVKLQF